MSLHAPKTTHELFENSPFKDKLFGLATVKYENSTKSYSGKGVILDITDQPIVANHPDVIKELNLPEDTLTRHSVGKNRPEHLKNVHQISGGIYPFVNGLVPVIKRTGGLAKNALTVPSGMCDGYISKTISEEAIEETSICWLKENKLHVGVVLLSNLADIDDFRKTTQLKKIQEGNIINQAHKMNIHQGIDFNEIKYTSLIASSYTGPLNSFADIESDITTKNKDKICDGYSIQAHTFYQEEYNIFACHKAYSINLPKDVKMSEVLFIDGESFERPGQFVTPEYLANDCYTIEELFEQGMSKDEVENYPHKTLSFIKDYMQQLTTHHSYPKFKEQNEKIRAQQGYKI